MDILGSQYLVRLFYLLIFLTSIPIFGSERCANLFSDTQITEKISTINISDLIEFVRVAEGGKRDLAQEQIFNLILSNNINFREHFLSQKSVRSSLSQKVIETLLLEHHNQFFIQYYNEAWLAQMRSEALISGLSTHGVNVTSTEGRRELEIISNNNLQKIFSKNHLLEPSEYDSEIVTLIDQVQIVMNRNSREDKIIDNFVLSSEQLIKYGLNGGLNSMSNFNKDFFKSGDFVYFFVNIYPKSNNRKIFGSEYGNFQFELDEQYAIKHAWISPFIMYDVDLVYFALKACPNEFSYTEAQWASKIRGNNYGYENDNILGVYRPSPTIVDLKNRLFNFDFTFSDFKRLILSQLGRVLTDLRANPHHYNHTYDEVRSMILGESSFDDKLLNQLILAPIGLAQVEAKIPVAVPKQYLRRRN